MSAAWAGAAWWLALAGASVLVALWHTTAIALGLALWRMWRPRTPARRAYAIASAALLLAVVLTALTPLVLGAVAVPQPASALSIARDVPTPGATPPPIAPAPPSSVSMAWRASLAAVGGARAVTAWIGALWLLGATAGAIRLAGGLFLAGRIRRQARPLTAAIDGGAPRVVGALPGSPAVLTSDHVDAPVVIGHRSPAILLPRGAEIALTPETLAPLLAHELAHVERRDYAANVAQSIADVALFFSPGARWISRTIREDREFCCDDLVAARCGTAPYVSALTTLAGLGALARARPALNVAGPRLLVRIRRLLQEDTMPRFASLRLAGLCAGLVVVALAGRAVVPLSARSLAQPGEVVFVTPIDSPIPIGFIRTQPGASVELTQVTSTGAGTCGTATVTNRANVAVTGLRFAAFAHVAGPEGSTLAKGSVALTELRDLELAPQAEATVYVNLHSLDALRATMRTGYPQVLCAIAEIRYANGATWSSPPATIFGPQHADVPRALLDGPPVPGTPICTDDMAREYSENAVVPVRDEPGTFARCYEGAWAEYALPPMRPTPGKPFVRMDLRVANGPSPSLAVDPGLLARISFGAAHWGLRPTLDPVDDRRVRIEVFDLTAQPQARVAEVWAREGGPAIDVPAAGFSIRIRSTRTF